MLLEFAALLVALGLIMLIVGVLVARQYTLRSKLMTAFLVIVLVSNGILAVMDNYLMRESLTESSGRTLAAAARHYANRIDQFNDSALESVKSAASLPAIRRILEKLPRLSTEAAYRESSLELMEVLKANNPGSVSIALLDRSGVNILDSAPEGIGKDESHNDYFIEIWKSADLYRSPLQFDADGEPSLYFSSGIRNDNGRLLGVLRARFDASVLGDIIKSSRGYAGLGSFAILLDGNLLRLAHGRNPDLNYTLAQSIGYERLKLLRDAKQVPAFVRMDYVEPAHWITAVEGSSGETRSFVKPLYGLGLDAFATNVAMTSSAPWRVVFAQPQEIVLQPVRDQTSITLLVAGAIALLVILIVMGTTQVLLGPVRRLTDTVLDVSSGQLQKRAQVEAADEIGSLATAFNTMTDNIHTLVSDLEDEVKRHRETSDHLRKISQAIDQSPASVFITDLDGVIEYANPECCRSSGYSSDELIGETPRLFNSGETPAFQFRNLWNTIISGRSWSGELYNRKRDGTKYWESVTVSPIKNEEGEVTHYLAIKEDISLRKEYEEKLLYQATYDNLTDLPNRSLAFDRLVQSINIAAKEGKEMALLFIDFDHFKNINDTLGHTAGDKFLILMADRLRALVRDIDTVARLGGDEYLVILSSVASVADPFRTYEEMVCDKAKTILDAVSVPCVIENQEFSITASIGIALYPKHGDDAHILLRNADAAMYKSKQKGRNTSQLYESEMNETALQRVEIESRLRHALDEGSFHLMYQPLVDAETRRIVGAEALLRWHDEKLGDVNPEIFVPYAEESGLIVDISNWVVERACQDLASWHRGSGDDTVFTAINLSARQFRDSSLLKVVDESLQRHKLPGHCLELEITERLLMKDVSEVIVILNQLKEMGITLSIDDFGTGYSSLSYLKRFPFDVLKIDRAFIKDIGVDPDDEALCDAVIAIAHSLGLKIIGEGVETAQQYEFLRDRGAEIIQGYYFSKPLSYDDFLKQLQRPDWLA